MNCPQCGRQVPQGAAVCPMCGFNLSQAYGAQTVFGGQMPPGGPGAMQGQPQQPQQPSPYAPPGMQGMQQPQMMQQPGMHPPMQQQPSPYAPPGMHPPQQGMGGVPNMQQPSSPSQPAYQPFQGGSTPNQQPYQPGPQMMGGAPMMASTPAHTQVTKKGGNTGLIIGIVAALVLVGGGAAAYFLTRGGDSKTAADQGSGTATASGTDVASASDVAAAGGGSAAASGTAAVATGASCQDVGNKLKSDTLAKMGPNAGDTDKQMLEKLSTIVVRHCMDDAWSADVIHCGVTSSDAKTECDPKLTEDQRTKLHAELDTASGTGSGSAVAASGDLAGLTAIRDTICACKDADCASKALEQFDTWGNANGDKIGTSIDFNAASTLINDVQTCMQKVSSGDDLGAAVGGLGGSGAGTGTAAAASGGACDAFLAITDAIIACDKFPESSKDGLKQAADMIKQYRAGGAMDETCQSSGESLADAAKAVGCVVPAMPAAAGAAAGTDTPVEATGDGKTGVKECDDMIAAYDSLGNCSKMPKSARDSFKQAEAQLKDSLGQMAKYGSSMNDTMKDACQQGLDALKQSAKSMGCKL